MWLIPRRDGDVEKVVLRLVLSTTTLISGLDQLQTNANDPDVYNSELSFSTPLLTVAVVQAQAAIAQAQLSGPVRSGQTG